MEGKLPEEQVKSLLLPWRFSLQSSGFEHRLVTALELYDHFPLDVVVTGGTNEANTKLAIALCGEDGLSSEEEEEDTSDEEEEDVDDEDDVEREGDEEEENHVQLRVGIAAEKEEEEEEEEDDRSSASIPAKVPRERKTHVTVTAYASDSEDEGSDCAPILLHPYIPNIRIRTVEGGSSSIQNNYDVLVVLTSDLHQEDHVRITMEQREKDKPLYLVKAQQELDLVSEKLTGPCMTCAWERMRARNLELQKKHKLALESGENAKEREASSGLPQPKLLRHEEIPEVLMTALPELRKKAFSQFLVDITRELRVPKVPSSSTTPLVCSALKSRKLRQDDLDQISVVFYPRDLTDQPTKLLSILTALEHFRLDVGLLGETGCGSSSLLNSLLGLQNGEKGAASVGVTETTQEPAAYPYRECHNTLLWDLPGLGRVGDLKNQSDDSGLQEASLLPSNLPACDVYVLVSPMRLGLGYIRLLEHLSSQGKSCYLVISKADLLEEKSIEESSALSSTPIKATMELDSNGLSVQCYLKPRVMGKVRRRLHEMRSPSAQLSTVDLSHNESARLATDALLDHGLKAYQDVLAGEEEADFLSMEEKSYILGNVKEPVKEEVATDEDMSSSSSESSSQTYFPMVSDSEPPCLDFGWPVADWSYHLHGLPSAEVYFQSLKSASRKDLLRDFIRKATSVLAIVMDTFSDVEIFCDVLEATKKRNVSVYLLLDHSNLNVFKEMCANLQINKSHLGHMSVRSIAGETYCAKSGRKFTGQVKEKFMIVDCTHVMVGTYSFTWLSWQVDRSLVMLFKGASVKAFDIEFRRLFATSKPVPEFSRLTNSDDPSHLHLMNPPTLKCLRGTSNNTVTQANINNVPYLQRSPA
ncbi:hypothetical protein NFI96_032867, partial [Prochilodus magdalenae]